MNFSNVRRLFVRGQIPLADSTQSDLDRAQIDAFLFRTLPEDEQEFIESYFISDDATILDCSMAEPCVLIDNCRKEYGVNLSLQELKMPLHVLVSHVKALQK